MTTEKTTFSSVLHLDFFRSKTLLAFPVAKHGEEEKVVFRRTVFQMELQRMVIYVAG